MGLQRWQKKCYKSTTSKGNHFPSSTTAWEAGAGVWGCGLQLPSSSHFIWLLRPWVALSERPSRSSSSGWDRKHELEAEARVVVRILPCTLARCLRERLLTSSVCSASPLRSVSVLSNESKRHVTTQDFGKSRRHTLPSPSRQASNPQQGFCEFVSAVSSLRLAQTVVFTHRLCG